MSNPRELHISESRQGRQLDVGENGGHRCRQVVAQSGRGAQREPRLLRGRCAVCLGYELRRVCDRELFTEVPVDEVRKRLVRKARTQEPSGEERVVRKAAEADPRAQ